MTTCQPLLTTFIGTNNERNYLQNCKTVAISNNDKRHLNFQSFNSKHSLELFKHWSYIALMPFKEAAVTQTVHKHEQHSNIGSPGECVALFTEPH